MGVPEGQESKTKDYGGVASIGAFVYYAESMVRKQPKSFGEREAFHMLLHKIGRYIHGNMNRRTDTVTDIAGYAALMLEEHLRK